MKLLYSLILAVTLGTTFAQNFDYFDRDLESIIENEKKKGDFLINGRSSNLTNNYDVTHQKCEWSIDPAIYYIAGKVTTTLTPTQPNVEMLEFDLNNNMTVNSIMFEGNALTYTQTADHLLRVTMPAPLNMETSYEIEIDYEGEPASGGFGSFNQTTHGNGAEEAPILWTLSEPYGARNWWPCKQNLNDKIGSIDIYVTVPSINKVGSNGLLVESTVDGDNVTYHWQHNHPIATYLVAIAVTNYVEYTDVVEMPVGDNIPVLNYVYPEDLDYAQANTPNVIPMIELYNDLFGLYAFADEKYGHAQFPWGGGMEHQTMGFMVNFSFGLMAHELAHQWFGDDVTCGSWQDLWLNESFATYLTGLSYKNIEGEASFYNWKTNVINYVTSQPDGSVWVNDTANINRLFSSRLTYNKGAIVLNMMRWKVGDEAFFSGVQDYRNSRSAGYARTADLKAAVENASGMDLTEFLDDWFYGEGYPTYDVQVSTSLASSSATVQINQSTSHVSVDFFEMPVPIRFTFDDGTDSIYVFEHTSNGQTFNVDLPMPVMSVDFDPNLEICSRDNTINLTTLVGNVNLLNDQSFLIYPNPTSNQLNIVNKDQNNPTESFDIYDATGRMILTQKVGGLQDQINTKAFKAGLYIIKITTKKGVLSKRFIVK